VIEEMGERGLERTDGNPEVQQPEETLNIFGKIRATLWHNTPSKIGLVTIVAIFAFIFAGRILVPYPPDAITGAPYHPPDLAHPFGTDYLGRDLLSQVVWGAVPTFAVSVASAIISVGIGFPAGLFSGYFTKMEPLLGGTTDIFLAFPILPLIVLMGELFVATNLLLIVILGILLWPPLARAVRAQVQSLKTRPYVEAAKISGVGDMRIVSSIMVPQTMFLAVAYTVINISLSTIIVTAVEFLGVGNPNAISLGSILYWAQDYAFTAGAWWWILAPGVIIALFAVGLGLMGFSLERVLNPRLRSQ
jgi:peptide/nickel transport system permease protein